MKKFNGLCLFLFIISVHYLEAYDWPIKEDTVQHVIISTLGEWRSSHFHAGVDIPAPCSTKVYAIEGDTCYRDTISEDGINIGHFRYGENWGQVWTLGHYLTIKFLSV